MLKSIVLNFLEHSSQAYYKYPEKFRMLCLQIVALAVFSVPLVLLVPINVIRFVKRDLPHTFNLINVEHLNLVFK